MTGELIDNTIYEEIINHTIYIVVINHENVHEIISAHRSKDCAKNAADKFNSLMPGTWPQNTISVVEKVLQ